jgi:hypothetical protein
LKENLKTITRTQIRGNTIKESTLDYFAANLTLKSFRRISMRAESDHYPQIVETTIANLKPQKNIIIKQIINRSPTNGQLEKVLENLEWSNNGGDGSYLYKYTSIKISIRPRLFIKMEFDNFLIEIGSGNKLNE